MGNNVNVKKNVVVCHWLVAQYKRHPIHSYTIKNQQQKYWKNTTKTLAQPFVFVSTLDSETYSKESKIKKNLDFFATTKKFYKNKSHPRKKKNSQ